MGQESSTSNNSSSSIVPTNFECSDFYVACRNGDVVTVEQMLSHLNTAEINRIEQNQSTALHAASFYGHVTTVKLLLEHGAQTWILNKYNMTAYQEAANEEVRALFHRPTTTDSSRFVDDDEETNRCIIPLVTLEEPNEHGTSITQIPKGWVNGYNNLDQVNQNKAIRLIVRTQLMKYTLKKFQLNDFADELRKILRRNVASNHKAYHTARSLFDDYTARDNVESLIRLYTLETPFYRALHANVDAFVIEMYGQLQKLQNRAFKGLSYRGLSMATKDISEYQWAANQKGKLIEIKTLTSTSVDSQVAYNFARKQQTDNSQRHRVVCEFQFDKNCCTALDLRRNDAKNLLCLSAYEDEAEVLVLPGTIFEVQEVRQAEDTRRYTIILRHVYVPLGVILEAVKEFNEA